MPRLNQLYHRQRQSWNVSEVSAVKKCKTYKVVAVIVRGTILARSNRCSQAGGGARKREKLSVAHGGDCQWLHGGRSGRSLD